MPSSYSASLRLELQFTGENVNTWGVRLNSLFTRADFAIAGRAIVALTGANYALTSSNTADDEARAAVLEFTGTGGCTVTIPSVAKQYTVQNSANAAVVIATGAGATVSVDPGDVVQVVCDGANVEPLGYAVGGILLSTKDYIAQAILGATGSLPAASGNAGKYLFSNGSTWLPRAPVVADLTDYASDQAAKAAAAATLATARAIAFAIAL